MTIGELGMVRSVRVDGALATVVITPTYPACPAIAVITGMITDALRAGGVGEPQVQVQLSPPWTSEWISSSGRAKLAAAGVAPPQLRAATTGPIPLTLGVATSARCPRCASTSTQQTSPFGPTACTALHRCRACGEPFEAVKAV